MLQNLKNILIVVLILVIILSLIFGIIKVVEFFQTVKEGFSLFGSAVNLKNWFSVLR